MEAAKIATSSPGLFPQKMGGAHPFFEGKPWDEVGEKDEGDFL